MTNVLMVTSVLMAVLHPDDNRDCSHVSRGRCANPRPVSQHTLGSLAPAKHLHDLAPTRKRLFHELDM